MTPAISCGSTLFSLRLVREEVERCVLILVAVGKMAPAQKCTITVNIHSFCFSLPPVSWAPIVRPWTGIVESHEKTLAGTIFFQSIGFDNLIHSRSLRCRCSAKRLVDFFGSGEMSRSICARPGASSCTKTKKPTIHGQSLAQRIADFLAPVPGVGDEHTRRPVNPSIAPPIADHAILALSQIISGCPLIDRGSVCRSDSRLSRTPHRYAGLDGAVFRLHLGDLDGSQS